MPACARKATSTPATSNVTGQCRQSHRHQEYLAFLRRIDK